MFMKVGRYITQSGRDVIDDYIRGQSLRAQGKCWAVIRSFELYGFDLHPKFLKRLTGYKNIWELRITAESQHRLLLAIMSNNTVQLIHAFTKKSQKTPIKEIRVALKRINTYEKT